MSTVTRHNFSKHQPLEDTYSSRGWRQYCKQHLVTKALRQEVKIRTRWVCMMFRTAISTGSQLSLEQMERMLNENEGNIDLKFSDDAPVNKARLRVGKYTVSFCLARVRDETSYFIATGDVLRHKKHLTQDVG